MTDFVISDAPAFSGDQFDELCKADKPSGGGWQRTPKGWKRRRGGKWEYYYPHPDGKPGKRVKKTKKKAKRSEEAGDVSDQAAAYFGPDQTTKKIERMAMKMAKDHPQRLDDSFYANMEAAADGSRIKTLPHVSAIYARGIASIVDLNDGRLKGANVTPGAAWARGLDGFYNDEMWQEELYRRGGQRAPWVAEKSEGAVDEFDSLMKAAGHKYKRRWRGKGGQWEYEYADDKGGSRSVSHEEHEHGGTDIPEYKLRVVGESHEEISKKLKEGIAASADICKTNPPVCHGNLGIERKDMPQFDTDANPDVIQDYLKAFQDKGVNVNKTSIPAGKLKATQKEIQTKKAYGMAEAFHEHQKGQNKWAPNLHPVVVSKDGYILDGHHRWAATTIADPSAHMPVFQVDAPIKDLLEMSEKFYREGRGVKKAGFAAASIGVKKSLETAGDVFVYGRWRERLNKTIAEADAALAKAGHLDEFEALEKAYPTGAPTLGELMIGRMRGKQKPARPAPLATSASVSRSGETVTKDHETGTVTRYSPRSPDRRPRRVQAAGHHLSAPMKGKVVTPTDFRGRMKGKQRGVQLTPGRTKPSRPPKRLRPRAQMAHTVTRAGFGPTRR